MLLVSQLTKGVEKDVEMKVDCRGTMAGMTGHLYPSRRTLSIQKSESNRTLSTLSGEVLINREPE
jgi:hypothetical protein